MRGWFPFTDYEFYAYITSGVIVIAGVDYTLFGGVLVERPDWTVVQGVFWTMISYLVGHITAGLSSFVLEQILAKKIFHAPELIILRKANLRCFEKLFKLLFAAEYSPFPEANSKEIMGKLATKLGCDETDIKDAETIFQTAFVIARYEPSSEERLNQFMNLYGLCRNVAFAALLVAALIGWKLVCNPASVDNLLLLAASVLSVGMFGRFLKFYSAYTREVLRTFGRKCP